MYKKGLKTLGQKIKRLRKERGLFQVDLAVRVGISPSYVGAIEQGLRHPSLKVLEKIAKNLRVSLSEILKD